MVNALRIELLKSRRTRSFSLAIILMLVALLWNLVSLASEFSSRQLDAVGVLFNNQTVNSLLLPIAISIFTSRIVNNERVGQTFKLQNANGKTTLKIFDSKLILTALFFLLIAIGQTGAVSLYASVHGVHVPLPISLLQVIGQFLASLSLITLYLFLALVIEKQGLLLSLGFMGGFFGLVLASKTSALWSFILPFLGAGYLAPYKFTLLDSMTYTYVLDACLGLRLMLYLAYLAIIAIAVRIMIARKETLA
ncbi:MULTISPECIES: ABC transporter permease [Aerococcus]|uniref:ABC transporter permease n=1 Tax=Aerococcus loyolae TaxID=2976809 RepID=A0ABT4BXL1_9LACT|nr:MULTISPECIES: ABC transporter permease [Aerococcus]KAA9220737.1 transporter [Aerococcus loyolae]KAA9265685.1 transporter [Aerococcus loyolae]MCY3025002.1 ABC transporter permease [Aerococcus loyolae]MCY3026942.1 ABC transporter permease [Aerococcus loyolae]MCY3028526.1 ABC transporter permease [Aerococcus loyolae]